MKLSVLAFALSLLAPLASSSAIPVEDSADPYAVAAKSADAKSVEKRYTHNVRLCTNSFGGGHCAAPFSQHNQCIPLASDLEDKVSSIYLLTNSYCRFFFNRGCSSSEGHFDTVSSINDLGNYGGNSLSNDKISSYQCFDR